MTQDVLGTIQYSLGMTQDDLGMPQGLSNIAEA